MADDLKLAWLDLFALLPDGWAISRPSPDVDDRLWTVHAVRKSRPHGDPAARVRASGADESSAVRAMAEEFRRLGYARAPRVGPGRGVRRGRTRWSSSGN